VLEIPSCVIAIDSLTIAPGESPFRLFRAFLESSDDRRVFRYLGKELEVMIVKGWKR
jgi:hypothetical protein